VDQQISDPDPGLNYNVAISSGDPHFKMKKYIYVTFFGKTDTNAFPFIWRNRLQSIYTRLNSSCKLLNGLLICLKKVASV